MDHKIYRQLDDKSISKEDLALQVKKNPDLLPVLLEGVSSSKASIRYGCGNTLKLLSEDRPELLYSHMGFFASLLESEYRILTWIAMAVLANLVEVDSENKFDTMFDKYFSFISIHIF